MEPKNERQIEEEELKERQLKADPRLESLHLITVIGEDKELKSVMKYLEEEFSFLRYSLPKFTRLPDLGQSCLIINYKDWTIYKTEIGLTMSEWRRFYLPYQHSELVEELAQEAVRQY